MSPEHTHQFDELYTAFASVPKPRTIDGCRCCIEDKEVHLLLTKPLREISAKEMTPYAGSALLTVGSAADYRYFLPRVLEIVASSSGWWPDWEVIGRTIRDAESKTWSEAEQRAVISVFDRQLQLAREKTDGCEIDQMLCGIACTGLDLTPYLSRLGNDTAAVLALYSWHANELDAGTLANGFWSDAQQGTAQMLAWFRSPEISLIVLDARGVDLGPPPTSSP